VAGRVHIVGCGALARELEWIATSSGFEAMTVEYLPARLHNTPDLIPGLVDERLAAVGAEVETVFVAYGDCGTGGLLDAVLDRHGASRLPGAHCYEFFATSATFAALHDREPGTFYLTDYLTRHFDRLVWSGLGLADHPELLPLYFGNYRRLVYLSQFPTDGLVAAAEEAALRLGLAFEHLHTGLGDLGAAVHGLARRRSPQEAPR
jgi:Protein of unknown function (DUF1638)